MSFSNTLALVVTMDIHVMSDTFHRIYLDAFVVSVLRFIPSNIYTVSLSFLVCSVGTCSCYA